MSGRADRLSALLPQSFQDELIVLKERKAGAGSGISGFLDTKIKLLGTDLEIADVYRAGLRLVSGAKDVAAEEEMVTAGADSSLKELLVITRQRKAILDDMADDVSGQTLEDAYTHGMVGKVMAASSKPKKPKFNKSKFRADVEDYYSAHRTSEDGEPQGHCALTGWAVSKELSAAHLVPASLSSEELSYLFGVGEAVLSDPRNGVPLNKNIEMALHAGAVAIVPVPSKGPEIARWKLLVTEPRMAKLHAMRGVQWRDLDGKELTFLNANRPARRFLYFRFIMTYLHSSAERKDGQEPAWASKVPDTGGAMWASPGPYLRKSMLRVLARQISQHFLPEALLADTTFEHAEGCTTRPAHDEKTLGLSLAVRVKAEMERSKETHRKALQGEEEESEGDEN